MHSTSLTQYSRQDVPQRQFARWLLVPMIATPITLMVMAASYISGGSLQASQNEPAVGNEITEAQTLVAKAVLESEQAQAQRNAAEQKYQASLTQLQATQAEQAELQTAYQDAHNRLDALKSHNQQQLTASLELKARIKQLQGANNTLNSQIQEQKLQITALQKRYETIENQKLQLTQENQHLQASVSQLETLKPELAKANQIIERLSSQLNPKPDQMTTININGQKFSVTQELAVALKTEQKQLSNQSELPTNALQSTMKVVK